MQILPRKQCLTKSFLAGCALHPLSLKTWFWLFV